MSETQDATAETVDTENAAAENAPVESTEEQAPVNEKLKWYVVHTYTGYENRAKKSLEERVKQNDLEECFGEVLIPVETVEEVRGGTKRKSKRKFFPGYMLVQMEMNDTTWHLVKSTPKVTGFVGNATKPPPVRPNEVARLTQQMTQGVKKAKPKVEFGAGEQIRVVDGPFANFNGTIEEVDSNKQTVKVLVSIFGRSTPVELDFMQVEKIG